MLLPIAPEGVAPLLAQLHVWDDGSGAEGYTIQPAGSANVGAAFALARAALDADDGRSAPRVVILETEGESQCDAAIAPADCDCFGQPASTCLTQPEGVLTCSDRVGVAAAVADALATDALATLVLYDDLHTAPMFIVDPVFLAAVATAGGLARAGAQPWYGLNEPSAFEDALRRRVAPRGWCWPRAVRPPPDPDDWGLESTNRGIIPRDGTHAEGWDWIDARAGTLRVYGGACDAAMADRGGLQLVAHHQICPR